MAVVGEYFLAIHRTFIFVVSPSSEKAMKTNMTAGKLSHTEELIKLLVLFITGRNFLNASSNKIFSVYRH